MQRTLWSAREFARDQPGASLPCPVCAASLKAANLERHLGQVHQVALERAVPPAEALELVGVDRRGSRASHHYYP